MYPGLLLRLTTILFLLPGSTMISPARGEEPVRLNQIQVIGTHNSYHQAPHPSILKLLGERGQGLDYSHAPLVEQFYRLGIRQVELDVFADSTGGRYARPSARTLLSGLGKDPGPDPNVNGVLEKPGFKILHVQDVDFMSTTPTLEGALRQINDWSSQHPGHVPIFVLLELKEEVIPGLATRPERFEKEQLDALDSLIRSVIPVQRRLEPDQVRGSSASLSEAVKTRGWPALDEVRGKVLFALDNEDRVRDLYLEGHPSLNGRVLFVSVARDHPAAAWMKQNDAIKDFEEIERLVSEGFLVRTRADVDTREARNNDTTRREKALASGAQFISTDYPEPRPELGVYQVSLPEKQVARLNPVSGRGLSPKAMLDRAGSPQNKGEKAPDR